MIDVTPEVGPCCEECGDRGSSDSRGDTGPWGWPGVWTAHPLPWKEPLSLPSPGSSENALGALLACSLDQHVGTCSFFPLSRSSSWILASSQCSRYCCSALARGWGWEMEKGKSKGGEVRAPLGLYHCVKSFIHKRVRSKVCNFFFLEKG